MLCSVCRMHLGFIICSRTTKLTRSLRRPRRTSRPVTLAPAATVTAHALDRLAIGKANQCKVSSPCCLLFSAYDQLCRLTFTVCRWDSVLTESVEGLGPDERTDTWTTLGIEPSQSASQQSATAKKISQRIFELLRVAYDPTIAVRRISIHPCMHWRDHTGADRDVW